MKRVVIQNPDDETRGQSSASEPAASASPSQSALAERIQTARRHKQSLPPDLKDIFVPSLKVGAVAGACGVFTGAAAGIVRSAPTVLFSVIAGGQWFTLASSYYAARLVGLRYLGQGEPSPRDKVKASTVAGGVAGSLGGLLRGPRNVLPGALVFSIFGAGGQAIVNWRAAKAAEAAPEKPKEGFWSRWSPIKHLSDQDYENILEEKLLRVEADIALVDDRIKELLESEGQTKPDGGSEEASTNPASSNKA